MKGGGSITPGARRTAMVAAAAGLLCLLGSGPAAAETLKPTRFDDPSPGKCKPNNCSLREAVVAANKSVGETTIRLEKGRYKLQIVEDGSSNGKTGDLDVIGPAKIRGEGAGKTRIRAVDINDRVFDLGAEGRIGRPQYTLRSLTIHGGDAGVADGGGVLIGFSETTLKRVVIRNNAATSGGGIAAPRAILRIKQSTIANNVASLFGGGLFLPSGSNRAEASIRASTFSLNSAAIGGGISLEGPPSQSSAQPPELDAVNSTFAGNQATVSGGGIHANSHSDVLVDNTTIAYNGADTDNSGGGAGGGVRQATDASFALTDSILAENTVGVTGDGSQCDGTFNPSSGNLLVGQTGTCSINATVAADALIDPLAFNGGPTKTIKLLSGSPAIGLAVTCPARDQRGVERPPEDCDSGSFERKNP